MNNLVLLLKRPYPGTKSKVYCGAFREEQEHSTESVDERVKDVLKRVKYPLWLYCHIQNSCLRWVGRWSLYFHFRRHRLPLFEITGQEFF